MRIDDLFKFMEARHRIYLERQAGKPKPWTDDVILQSYRFCNVYRQLDTETQWIANNWLKPHAGDPELWFAMLVARFVNWSPTLDQLGYPVPWDFDNFVSVLTKRKKSGEKVWTGAYMVCTNNSPTPKPLYYAELFNSVWKDCTKLRPREKDTLFKFHDRLTDIFGVGSFIAGQVIADLKHDRLSPLYKAPDWGTWSVQGPGSKRGMNRVLGRPVKFGIDDQMWQDTMLQLRTGINARISRSKVLEAVDAQDLQNCLCEWDKYERVRLGQGKPRAIYNGRGE